MAEESAFFMLDLLRMLQYIIVIPTRESRKMTKSEILKAAHKLAKAIVCKVGDYLVALQYAMKSIYGNLRKNSGFTFSAFSEQADRVAKKYALELNGFFTNGIKSTNASGKAVTVYTFASKAACENNTDKSFGQLFELDGELVAYKY